MSYPKLDLPPTQAPSYTCVAHPKATTRLTCTECEQPICTRCIVPCEVGFKCKRCIKGKKSHVIQTPVALLVRMAVLAMGMGALCWGALYWAMGSASLSSYLLIIAAFVIGAPVGNMLQACTQHKLSVAIRHTMCIGMAAGVLVSQAVCWQIYGHLWPLNEPIATLAAIMFIVGARTSYK